MNLTNWMRSGGATGAPGGLVRRWLATVLALAAAGCASLDKTNTTPDERRQQAAAAEKVDVSLHAVIGHKNGLPVSAKIEGGKVKWSQPMLPEDNRRYLTRMLAHMKATAPIRDGKKQILIFIHGGMNFKDGAVLRTQTLSALINGAKPREYYPICIDWDSGPFSTYGDHLFTVRRGSIHSLEAKFTWPIVLATDLARGVSRAPLVWGRLGASAGEQPGGWNYPPERLLVSQEILKETRRAKNTGPHVSNNTIYEDDLRTTAQSIVPGAHTLFFAPKMATGMIIDIIGTGAWDMMLRRSELLFRSQTHRKDLSPYALAQADMITAQVKKKENRDARGVTSPEIQQAVKQMNADPAVAVRHGMEYASRTRPGAVEQFLCELESQLGSDAGSYSITLIGHSMGAIVSNEILATHPKLPIDHIVYMAAACSVGECVRSVGDYLLRKPHAQFYNLCLHPICEVAESNPSLPTEKATAMGVAKGAAGLLVPRGSLLVWLDEFFTKPVTLQQRRMGKWRTSVTEVNLFPPKVQNRVHLKMFPAGPQDVPQKHGAFASEGVKFWAKEFREPATRWTPRPR